MPRILPFALFMGFIALEALLRWAAGLTRRQTSVRPRSFCGSIPYALQWYWQPWCISGQPMKNCATTCVSTSAKRSSCWSLAASSMWRGCAWIGPGPCRGNQRGTIRSRLARRGRWCWRACGMFGAVIVVPIMEELFWRSFLIRYLVTPTFTTVRLGTFTPLSGGATVVLFGLEHHLWLAGMMAGAIYNLLLYKTRRLWPCILAHAITNLLLGIHVLVTGEWHWW